MKIDKSDSVVNVLVPAMYAALPTVDKNHARQLLRTEETVRMEIQPGGRRVLTLGDGRAAKLGHVRPKLTDGEIALVTSMDFETIGDGTKVVGRWVGSLPGSLPDAVFASLENALSFKPADESTGQLGLRGPQLGAVHAVLAHWTTASVEPATVVMPTGTGKTETMLALLCTGMIRRLLVIVPSDALRGQIATKFETLGVLPELGIIPPNCLKPVVGRIEHRLTSQEAATTFVNQCNVVVTTAAALNTVSVETKQALIGLFTHVFIDEAHHVGADTWRQLRDDFSSAHVVQFTATPFREDGRRLGGRHIYMYPLREAQRQGYFSNVNYVAVSEMANEDQAIAEHAVERLRSDLAAGLDHLLMARVARISGAEDILALYQELAPDLHPVIIHSGHPAAERQAALDAVNSRESRIVLCVNMLGEGFDLPSLKIAALHDPHRSLGVTLQFIGRFARTTGAALGEATVVVSRPRGEYDRRLRKLYAEDSDWNIVLRELSHDVVQNQQETSEFEASFTSLPDEVTMRSLLPKMSTVVYRTHVDDWMPQGATDLFGQDNLFTYPIAINPHDRVAWFITERRTAVKWGELSTVEEVAYDLYVIYWDREQQLLYINSSNNSSVHEELARAVIGDSAARVSGENVYRVMANVQRLVPTNVGLLDVRNRSRRFSMHVGADVSEGFPEAEAQTKTKTNIFATGYEEGLRVSIGASLKGRIWSYRVADTLREWKTWCDYVGRKLTDDGISVDDVMRYFIRPRALESRPNLIPLTVEWPWEIYANVSDELKVAHDQESVPLVDLDMRILEFEKEGPILLSIGTANWSLQYSLSLDGDMKFSAVGPDAEVVLRQSTASLEQFLNRKGLFVYFEQDTLLVPPGLLLKPPRDITPFSADRLINLDWSDIDLRAESQGPSRAQNSIQARTIEHVASIRNWDIVLDDDGTGEMADVVALCVADNELVVHLTHCKFAKDGTAGSRVEDLYEVCGQAQKSSRWRRNINVFVNNLIRRERRRQEKGVNGFMKGDAALLYSIQDRLPLLRSKFTIAIAQPGVMKSNLSASQAELLAATEIYVRETANSDFEVYCNQ